MSTSPFELFRRNLKPFMIFATFLALISFVVLPILQTYMQQQAGSGGDDVVASFAGTSLTQNRVSYFTQNHQSTLRFLNELANETITRGGVPRTAGFQYDAQSQQIQSLGINQNPSPESTVRTFMFASEAEQAGFALDDSALQAWLERFTDGVISYNEIISRLMKSTQNQMGPPHLYEQLRNHLLADVYLRRGNAGLFGNEGPLLTPDEQWVNFLKLNQNAVVTTYGVLVNDYLDKTDPSPSDARIREVYEEGKDRDADDQSPLPGFHRRYEAKYEYLVGNIETYLDEEKAKLSDEAIRAEYERRLAGGDFQLPEEELPSEPETSEPETSEPEMTEPATEEAQPEETATEETQPEPAMEEPATEEPATEEPATEEPATEEPATEEPATEEPATEEPATEEPATEEPATEEPETEEPATEEPATEEPATEEPATEEPATEEPSAEDSAAITTDSAVRLVALIQDEQNGEAAQEETADEPPAEETEPAAEEETPAADAEPASATEPASTEEASPEPKVQTFEDVRDDIAAELARPAAEDRLNKAVSKANAAMRTYFSRMALHQSNVARGEESEPPARPDLKKLASEIGMQHEVIGPHSVATISEEPIAESFELGTQFARRGPSFGVMMYGFDNGQTQLPQQPLFAPIRTADDQAGKIYVTWKTEETDAFTPELAEVRDEVVMAIRMAEARQLAAAAADELAKKAQSGTPLADLVPEDKKDNLKEGLGPFTWMDSFGFQGATIGNIPELDSVGDEFMESTFGTDQGDFSTAPNQAGRVHYVVTPTKFEPSVDELRRQFKQPVNRMMARMIASDVNDIRQGFYEALDEKAGYEMRTPDETE